MACDEQELFKQLVQLRGYTHAADQPCIVHNGAERIQAFLCGAHKLDMAYFYKAYEQMDPQVTHMIFVYTVATIQIKKLKMYKDVLRIEFFSVNELRRLLRGNRLVPPHVRVDAATEARICATFGKENLPHLLQTDPIARLHDFKADTVVEIQRADAIYFRLVVPDE